MRNINLELNYGELSNYEDFVNICEDLTMNLIEAQKVLDQLLPLKAHYHKMSLPAQIELDLFLVFALNSLHWINLQLQGIDPNTHPIKDELRRIKATMVRWQRVKDRNKRPTLDIEATNRFVRSGLYDPYKGAAAKPPNQKIMFKDDN